MVEALLSNNSDLQDLKFSLTVLHNKMDAIESLLKPVPVQKWVSKKQAMQMTGASLRTLDNRLKSGLYTISKIGRRVMILRSDLEAHISQCTIKKGVKRALG